MTNGTWTQSAVEYLGTLGYEPKAAAEALGRYLSGTYTETDRSLITTALGALGAPPTGIYGYPTIAPSTATTPAGSGSPATPTTPTTPTTPAPAAPSTPTTPAPSPAASGGGGTINRPTIGATGKAYVVRAGDNWNTIASKAGKTPVQLRALNPGGLNALVKGKTVYV